MSNENPDPYLQMLAEWQDAADLLKKYKDKEMDLRKKLFAGAFPNPKEGTNTFKMADGRKLKGVHKIDRKIDEAALPAVLAALKEAGDPQPERLVRFKPELAKAEWNGLTPENKLIFAPAVIAVPGAPSFEVVGTAE